MGRPKKVTEENANVDFALDEMEQEVHPAEIKREAVDEDENPKPVHEHRDESSLVNCLKKVRVCVKYIPKEDGKIKDKNHIAYGGMMETAKNEYVVPQLSSGVFVNVLTDAEKDYLEYALGLEQNALSVYKKKDNFWSTATEKGIAKVTLRKQDNYLDLSDPIQYIKYKILLANKDMICPSLSELQSRPKATYKYVIINEGDEAKANRTKMSYIRQSYIEYGKHENESDLWRFILSSISGKKIVASTPLEVLQDKINDLIQADAKTFIRLMGDPLRDTKCLIMVAAEEGVIAKRGTFYYTKEGSSTSPMCENGEEPTLAIAAKWLSNPRRQELKFSIEDRISKR